MTTRLLTVEEFGDFFKARVLPTRLASQIRLKGQWLKRCGFPAGSLAKVTLVSPGVLDIRLVTQSESGTVRPACPGAAGHSLETLEQKTARLQVMQRLHSAIAFVDRVAVDKGRALLEAELLETFCPHD
jgi:hypothetical protein